MESGISLHQARGRMLQDYLDKDYGQRIMKKRKNRRYVLWFTSVGIIILTLIILGFII